MDEIRGLLCHTANLKEEVVKGIIQRSEFKPKLAQHAQCAALICFESQPVVSNHNSVEGNKRAKQGLSLYRTLCKHGRQWVGGEGVLMQEQRKYNLHHVLTKARTLFFEENLSVGSGSSPRKGGGVDW